MIQRRRERIYSIDAKIYLCDDGYDSFLNELMTILDEEVADFNSMPEGLRDGGRGTESREAQAYLQKAIKALNKVADGKKKTQELMDEVHENLRAV